MATKKLTDLSIEKLAPPDSGRLEVWDALLPGFGVRVSHRGPKRFFIMYRSPIHLTDAGNRKQRRLDVGTYGKVSLSDARELAREYFDTVNRGLDPADEKEKAAEEERKRIELERGSSFSAVANDFFRVYAGRKWKSGRGVKEVKSHIEKRANPVIGDKPISKVSLHDINQILDATAADAPVAANRVRSHLNKIFNWAISRGEYGLEHNPVTITERPTKEKSRERVLSDDELKALWQGCDAITPNHGAFVRLLMLTGQRRSEVAAIKRSDIVGQDWTIPGIEVKANGANVIPLSSLAMDTLAGVPILNSSDYVFPARGNPNKHLSGYKFVKQKLDQASGVQDWRLHDIRRTCSSNFARLGVAPHISEMILNHSLGKTGGGTFETYNRYSYLPERREALQQWSDYISEVVR